MLWLLFFGSVIFWSRKLMFARSLTKLWYTYYIVNDYHNQDVRWNPSMFFKRAKIASSGNNISKNATIWACKCSLASSYHSLPNQQKEKLLASDKFLHQAFGSWLLWWASLETHIQYLFSNFCLFLNLFHIFSRDYNQTNWCLRSLKPW